MLLALIATTSGGVSWLPWLSLLLGAANTAAIAVLAIMAVRGHRWQRRHQTAQEEERLELGHPFWCTVTHTYSVGPSEHDDDTFNEQVLRVEVVNAGHRDVFVRDVKLHAPGIEHAMTFVTLKAGVAGDPLRSGDHRVYQQSQPNVANYVKSLKGAWVTVESNRGEIARREVVPAQLAGG